MLFFSPVNYIISVEVFSYCKLLWNLTLNLKSQTKQISISCCSNCIKESITVTLLAMHCFLNGIWMQCIYCYLRKGFHSSFRMWLNKMNEFSLQFCAKSWKNSCWTYFFFIVCKIRKALQISTTKKT